MRDWNAQTLARAAGAELLREPAYAAVAAASEGAAGATGTGAGAEGSAASRPGPARAVVDSRVVGPGDLFVGLAGERADGGSFACAALEGGAWGALVAPDWGDEAARAGVGAVLVAPEPLLALHALARAWRRELAAEVIAVTGSVGKTSTKDLVAAIVGTHRSVVASRANFNTEIGLPLELLSAPAGTEVVVLELAMRARGQIAELTAICEPDVGVITNIGPVHLEQLGSLAGVAQAKGELLEGMRDGAVAIVPDGEPLLAGALRDSLRVMTFGGRAADAWWVQPGRVARFGDEEVEVELPFTTGPQLMNSLAALAAARAVGVQPSGRIDVVFSPLRGQRVALGDGSVVINDCYNASPPSMRAALDELATEAPAGRRIAVLGDMLELGPDELELHREIGSHVRETGIELLITVGARAAAMLDTFDGESHAVADAEEAAALVGELIEPGDLVLVKASNGVGLWAVADALSAEREPG